MKFTPTKIPEVLIIEPNVFGDQRGYFMEVYQAQVYADAGIDANFMQDNQSGSRRNTLRGLHYQIRHPQAKLVRVISGEVFDVAVDLRRSSPTLGQWVGAYLSAENRRQIWIPIGFAHGIYFLSDWAEVVYKVDNLYDPEWERTLLWNDSKLVIQWPLLNEEPPILSAKDALGLSFDQTNLFD